MRVKRLAISLAGLCLPFGLSATTANAATVPHFHATFVDIYSACPIHPPTLVFCGSGNIAGYGHASSRAHLTSKPSRSGDCLDVAVVRTITLIDNPGTLTLAESGTLCPPSPAASNAAGDPYTVAKTYTVTGATGVFAGASGSGTDIDRSAGNSQVSVLSGALSFS